MEVLQLLTNLGRGVNLVSIVNVADWAMSGGPYSIGTRKIYRTLTLHPFPPLHEVR